MQLTIKVLRYVEWDVFVVKLGIDTVKLLNEDVCFQSP